MGSKSAVDKQVGVQLQILRMLACLTIDEVADRARTKACELVDYESGRHRIAPSTLVRLAGVFGVPVSAFFGIIQPQATGAVVPGSLVSS